MTHYPKIILVSLFLIGASAATHASETMEHSAQAINDAAIPLTQAVDLAVKHAGGKATRAEYEQTRNGAAYDVEVINGDKMFDVRVDAQNGHIISYVEDPLDHDDQNDAVD